MQWSWFQNWYLKTTTKVSFYYNECVSGSINYKVNIHLKCLTVGERSSLDRTATNAQRYIK